MASPAGVVEAGEEAVGGVLGHVERGQLGLARVVEPEEGELLDGEGAVREDACGAGTLLPPPTLATPPPLFSAEVLLPAGGEVD